MITLELAPEVEKLLIKTAEQQGITVNQLVSDWTMKQSSPLVLDFIQSLPNRSYLGDPLTIQREIRDEWE